MSAAKKSTKQKHGTEPHPSRLSELYDSLTLQLNNNKVMLAHLEQNLHSLAEDVSDDAYALALITREASNRNDDALQFAWSFWEAVKAGAR